MEKGDAALKEVIEVSGNQNVVCKKLDLADVKSIREFAQNINSGKDNYTLRLIWPPQYSFSVYACWNCFDALKTINYKASSDEGT